MLHRSILSFVISGCLLSGATAMPASVASFQDELSELTSTLQQGDTTNASKGARTEPPSEHPWGGGIWLDDGYVTIDKAELGPVAARRKAFTLGFQRLPHHQCRMLLNVRDGVNPVGTGILQVSAKNIETERFVSFKGARLDTTASHVDIACQGEDDLFTVTVTFEYRS